MKKVLSSLMVTALVGFSFINGDVLKSPRIRMLPSVVIQDMDGNTVNTADASNDGNPIIIIFWSTSCQACELKLNAIHELYPNWQEETGLKLIAVSIDSETTKNTVRPYVSSMAWEFEVWMDVNGDFKRALGVNSIPQTFLLNDRGQIVFSHRGYIPGDEDTLYEEVLEVID